MCTQCIRPSELMRHCLFLFGSLRRTIFYVNGIMGGHWILNTVRNQAYPSKLLDALFQEVRINRMNHFYHLNSRFRELIFQLRKGLR